MPTLSAVMPVYNGRPHLERSLPPLLAQLGDGLQEVVVVDDGSEDGSGDYAESLGARLVWNDQRRGPASARNLGVRSCEGDLILFVDADVVVRPDAVRRVRDVLGESSDVVAVFGSYDDTPAATNVASLYMNLRHHHVHQRSGGEASTFWAGLGAVRREPFLAVGGFDAERYPWPSIEDIELGYRLRAQGGRIRLLPDAQGTHLKRWSVRELIRTDVLRRALPWARLLLSHPNASSDLNVAADERVRALLAAGLAASVLLALFGVAPLWLSGSLFAMATLANASFFRTLRRRAGPVAALAAMGLHQLYYVYGAVVYVGCWLERQVTSRNSASANL